MYSGSANYARSGESPSTSWRLYRNLVQKGDPACFFCHAVQTYWFDGFPIPVYHVDRLVADLADCPVDIGVLTAPDEVTYEAAEVLAAGGVKGIWNFSNAELKPQKGNPVIENVHLFDSLFSLCCMINGYDVNKACSY